MFKAYQYVFYRIYIWSCNTRGEKELPHLNAALGMAALTLFNIYTLLVIIEIITGIPFMFFGAYSKQELIVPALIYVIPHCYILLGNKRYKKIIAEYNQQGKEVHKKNTWWVMAYVIGTPLFYLLALSIAWFAY